MKKAWTTVSRNIVLALVIISMLFQAVPASAAFGKGRGTMLKDEDTYEAVPWLDWTMEGGIYHLVNKKSGLLLDAEGDSNHSEELSAVQIYEKTEGCNPSQQFRISMGTGGWNILPCSNTDLVVNPYSNAPKIGTRINLYHRDTDDITQSWKFKWIEEEEGWIIKSAYNEDLVLTAAGSANKSRVILRKYREHSTAQIWNIVPYRNAAPENALMVNGNCRITLPADWEGRYFTQVTEFNSKPCTDFYSSVCWENYEGSGRLFSIFSCDAVDENWPDYTVLGSADGQFIVLMQPSDVQFNPESVDATNEYIDMSADIAGIIVGAECGIFPEDEGGAAIIPWHYYGHSGEYETYMGVDDEGRLIETPEGYMLQDPERPLYDRGWFYDPDSETGRAKNLVLPGVWSATRDMWTEGSKEEYPLFSISFGLDGTVEILDGSGSIITGTYLLNVSDAETTVIALVDADGYEDQLIVSIYHMSMEIYGLPEITVENADGSTRKTRIWGLEYRGAGMVHDWIG